MNTVNMAAGFNNFMGFKSTMRLPKVIKTIKKYNVPVPMPNQILLSKQEITRINNPSNLLVLCCFDNQPSNPKLGFKIAFFEVLQST
ncbi:hypothetical protein [Tamlana crocina]|uniref:Uncharacterized protein n=1 Tax=Tamlana crocina TaxID=393006 RepID=A0ABX1DCE0_9FLAO|nr:hypothetical protein [Tamlana crocina]NJX14703.1 hypothetical protein [Tamlana crocina]